MRVVMPSLLPASEDEPYMCMSRFETGESGNPHFHGFSIGAVAHAWGVSTVTSLRIRRTTALRIPTTTARTLRR